MRNSNNKVVIPTIPYIALNTIAMRHSVLIFILISMQATGQNNAFLYNSHINRQDAAVYPIYTGKDLGVNYSAAQTTIKVWAPTQQQLKLFLYDAGTDGNRTGEYDMKKVSNGVWQIILPGNQAGKFYTVSGYNGSQWTEETTDPYSRAVGINGKRSAIIDMATANPKGWAGDRSPSNFSQKCDAIIYELHVRDATINPSSGVPAAYRGKFLGLTIPNTRNAAGQATGLSHLKALGITHVQLLPFYDFYTVDESQPNKPQYNWGYDPLHYNVPEGSYSTNAADPATRIKELKQLIQTLHQNGLRVVMDVVYNHTMLGDKSNFNILVPGYYYRTNAEGAFSNASGCGNETASDAPMYRQFMLQSLEYWVKEFHIDGFRFDLMAIHDIPTMNLISQRLHQLKPDILLHGEGWSAGGSPLAEDSRAVKRLTAKLDGIAVFSDEIRDGLKGGWYDAKEAGFVSGRPGMEATIQYGIVGAVQHPGVNYNKVNYSKEPFATAPWQCIVYNECHDNHTLWDRLLNSNPNDSEADRKKMYKLAQAIVLTSQGIPFIHAGQEMYRTKQGIDNSYNQPDSINQIDWSRLTDNSEIYSFTRQLIAIRKNNKAFRLNTAAAIQKQLRFLNVDGKEQLVGYSIMQQNRDAFIVLFNANRNRQSIQLPPGKWKALLNGDVFNAPAIYTDSFTADGLTAVVLKRAE